MAKLNFYDVFNYKTGRVVAHAETEWEAREKAEKRGSEYDYDTCTCSNQDHN